MPEVIDADRKELNAEFARAFHGRTTFLGAAAAVERIVADGGDRRELAKFCMKLMRDGYAIGAMRERNGKHDHEDCT